MARDVCIAIDALWPRTAFRMRGSSCAAGIAEFVRLCVAQGGISASPRRRQAVRYHGPREAGCHHGVAGALVALRRGDGPRGSVARPNVALGRGDGLLRPAQGRALQCIANVWPGCLWPLPPDQHKAGCHHGVAGALVALRRGDGPRGSAARALVARGRGDGLLRPAQGRPLQCDANV
jgi:hypothetical protein